VYNNVFNQVFRYLTEQQRNNNGTGTEQQRNDNGTRTEWLVVADWYLTGLLQSFLVFKRSLSGLFLSLSGLLQSFHVSD
jgi:hypothetical protein